MVPDGEDLYQVDPGAAKLDQGILLHYLDGFIDAGAAGRLLSAHLLGSLDHEAVVTFDVDRLIDYRSRRPPMTYDKDHWESYEAPEITIHQVRDSAGKTFLMLTGPEPDHEWERFTSAVTPSGRVCGTPIGMPWYPSTSSAPRRLLTEATALVNRSHSWSGSGPVSIRNAVPAVSRTRWMASSGAS